MWEGNSVTFYKINKKAHVDSLSISKSTEQWINHRCDMYGILMLFEFYKWTDEWTTEVTAS